MSDEVEQSRRLQADRIVETATSGSETWTTTYDRAHLAGGQLVPAQVVSVAPSLRTTTTVLNAYGEVASVQVGTLAPVVYAYDGDGRVTSISQTDGGQTRSVTFGYSGGWLHTVTDVENRTTTFQRDAVGRVLQQLSPVPSEVIAFSYDEDGNVTSVTPPSRPAHGFYYDSADRLRDYAPPVIAGVPDPETRYDYNLDGQTELTSLPQGSDVDFEYDPISGKLAGLQTPEADYVFVYDDGAAGATGRLESVSVAHDDMSIGTLSLTYSYDGNLLTGETLAGVVAGSVGWGYDAQHRLDAETVEGDTVVYRYDAQGRLTTMGAMTATYEPGTDLLETTTLGGGGGVETTYSYDGFGDLAGVLYEAANVPLYEVSYTRDTFGRVETKTEVRPGGTTLRCYEYDASDRLAAVYDAADSNGCTGSQLEAYTYDVNGNRASLTNSAGMVPAVDIITDNQDRLQQHGDFTYTYNEDGQMETRTQTSTGDVWACTYDAVGNLLEVDPPGAVAPTITYVTDPRNRRVGKRENGVLVQGFLYGDQLNPIADFDGSGAVVSRFVYGTSDHVPRAGACPEPVLRYVG